MTHLERERMPSPPPVSPTPNQEGREPFPLPHRRTPRTLLWVGLATVAAAVFALAALAWGWSSQDPASTADPSAATAPVTTSDPGSVAVVPSVIGRDLETARRTLDAAGLTVGQLRDWPAPDPAGVVVRQLPGGGTALTQGSAVDLWLSYGGTVAVPALGGLTPAAAQKSLDDVGLVATVTYESSDEGPVDTVVRQYPDAGTQVTPGATVTFVVNGSAQNDPAVAGGEGGRPKGAATAGVPSSLQSAPTDTTPGSPSMPAPAPALYRSLAAGARFAVLYPGLVPAGLIVDPAPGNPRFVADEQGGFEIRYVDPQRPGLRLSLLEGNWFDPGIDEPTSVDVRGRQGSLGRGPTGATLVWEEEGTRYGITAVGVDEATVMAIAGSLQKASTGMPPTTGKTP